MVLGIFQYPSWGSKPALYASNNAPPLVLDSKFLTLTNVLFTDATRHDDKWVGCNGIGFDLVP